MIDEFCEKQLSECLHVKQYKDRKRRRTRLIVQLIINNMMLYGISS
jgi:hypothetical protein